MIYAISLLIMHTGLKTPREKNGYLFVESVVYKVRNSTFTSTDELGNLKKRENETYKTWTYITTQSLKKIMKKDWFSSDSPSFIQIWNCKTWESTS